MSGGSGGGDTWRPTPPVTSSNPGSGTGSGAGGGQGGGTPSPCDIVEITPLNSPDRTVINMLRQGDVLEVVFQNGPPKRLIAQTAQGSIAGSITSPSMLQIIACITNHNIEYVAEVMSIRGAICQVTVRVK